MYVCMYVCMYVYVHTCQYIILTYCIFVLHQLTYTLADALCNKKGWGSKSATSFTKSKKTGQKSMKTNVQASHQKATTIGE